MRSFEWLLFDIGGVLVEFAGAPKILEWMNWRVSREEMSKMWLYSNSVRAYETGKITSSEFAENIVKEFKLTVNPDEFIKGFTQFPKGLYQGVDEFLSLLAERYQIATLSNTNEIHWNRLCKENNFDNLIKNNYLSFQTGYMKPDKEAYMKVLDELNCSEDKIIFFDDNKINIEAAKEIRMKAVCVSSFDNLREKIIEMGIF